MGIRPSDQECVALRGFPTFWGDLRQTDFSPLLASPAIHTRALEQAWGFPPSLGRTPQKVLLRPSLKAPQPQDSQIHPHFPSRHHGSLLLVLGLSLTCSALHRAAGDHWPRGC